MHHDLPDIARLGHRLAADNHRVARCIDRLPQRAEALVEAVRRTDVPEIRRLSENLAAASGSDGLDTVRYRAERVCEELKKPNNLRAIRHSVVRLIGACGGAARADQARDTDWQI